MPRSATTVFKNVCPLDCPDTCSMRVTVEDGVAVELAATASTRSRRGFLCEKMARLPGSGLQRPPPPAPDEARRAEGVGAVRADHVGRGRSRRSRRDSARSPNPTTGPRRSCRTAITARWASSRPAASTAASSTASGRSRLDRTICSTAGGVGYEYTIGRGRLGADPLAVPKCKLIINWGSNTVHTNSHLWSLDGPRPQGPRRHDRHHRPVPLRHRDRSDRHIQPRPGTDAALAPGLDACPLARRARRTGSISSGRPSAPNCSGDRVLKEYAPDRVAAITNVDVETIEIARPRWHATTRPSLIRLNYGLQRHRRRRDGGADDHVPAGDRRLLAPPRRRRLALDQRRLRLRDGPPHPPRPLAARHPHRQHERAGPASPRRAARPSDQSIVRLQLQPRRRRPRAGQGPARPARDDLFTVVHEQFATDTVDYADIVLPATTQLEHIDIHGAYGHHFVMLNEPAIAPRGEARSNNDVFRALASRLGLEPALFPDDETLIRQGSTAARRSAGSRRNGSGRRARSGSTSRSTTPRSPPASSRRRRASASCTPSG